MEKLVILGGTAFSKAGRLLTHCRCAYCIILFITKGNEEFPQ